ncbi:hypothetical protein WA026_023254 [Henosepilachna vigintioctopunctata]|uniref:Cathepsin propeptide inhibitor domain-containing protein n=1 Tax=Henosepilachna vigintioctopunctata TaxID=420089 RepID=A0AAW1UVS3_9CUCU
MMKHSLWFCLVVLIILFNIVSSRPVKDLEGQWAKFKVDNNRNYGSPEEEARRKEIFKKTLEFVEEHNEKYARGLSTYTVGINFFADMTEEERKRYTGFKRPTST